jgi:3-hydroxymyristoyl/3-hydroxydecanoyl-(acyl carrier protein) dehydratase
MQLKNDPFTSHMKRLHSDFHETAETHRRFLELRRSALQQSAAIIALQITSYGQKQNLLFSTEDLKEFAEGDVVKCLGQNYSVYDKRRSPRIPNGDLLLISRVLAIRGKPGQFHLKANITSEYDVPKKEWYLSENEETDYQPPISICLEVALQPCGFLSAYMETPLCFPDEDYYFRNLDGKASYIRRLDVRGKTIRVHAELEKTIFSGTTIIQDFYFELLCGDLVFFKGRSSFGYFPAHIMAAQVGLDKGEPTKPWLLREMPSENFRTISINGDGLPGGRLRLIDNVIIEQHGGIHKAGYAYSKRSISAEDWYFACHFYQDPVMPGSLGIEAIVQAMTVLMLSEEKSKPTVYIAIGQEIEWKYRGQVLQENKEIQVEVHIQDIQIHDSVKYCSGEASLWADDKRIYEIHNLTLALPG